MKITSTTVFLSAPQVISNVFTPVVTIVATTVYGIGERGLPGSDVLLTNNSINVEIEKDPSATISALGLDVIDCGSP